MPPQENSGIGDLMTVRREIAAVDGEQRALLRFGEPRVRSKRGFRCIVVLG